MVEGASFTPRRLERDALPVASGQECLLGRACRRGVPRKQKQQLWCLGRRRGLVVASAVVTRKRRVVSRLGVVVCFSRLRDGTAGLGLWGLLGGTPSGRRGVGGRQHVSLVPTITDTYREAIAAQWRLILARAPRHQPPRDPRRVPCFALRACPRSNHPSIPHMSMASLLHPPPGVRTCKHARSLAGGDDAFCYCAQTVPEQARFVINATMQCAAHRRTSSQRSHPSSEHQARIQPFFHHTTP